MATYFYEKQYPSEIRGREGISTLILAITLNQDTIKTRRIFQGSRNSDVLSKIVKGYLVLLNNLCRLVSHAFCIGIIKTLYQ